MTNTLPSDYVPNKIRTFVDGLVYSREEHKDVATAMLGVSHVRDAFTTVPYMLATAKTPASGKTTLAADIPSLLAFNTWPVSRGTTIDAIRSKFLERVRPNLVLDDIGKIFGDAGTAGKMHPIYTVLVQGYRKDGTASMSINRVATDVSTYNMSFMNGLHSAVPSDLFTRAIHFQMEEAPSGIELRDALDDSVRADAKVLKEALHAWAGARAADMTAFMRGPVRFIHPKLEKRKRQIWGPVFAFAAVAGGDWPRRIFDAFVSMALDASDKPVLVPEQRLLLDTAELMMRRGLEHIFTADLLVALRSMPEGVYYREADDTHLIQRVFPEALGTSKVITATALYGDHAGQRGRAKGFNAGPILESAADLRDMLYPPMEVIPDETEAELAFTPVKGRNTR